MRMLVVVTAQECAKLFRALSHNPEGAKYEVLLLLWTEARARILHRDVTSINALSSVLEEVNEKWIQFAQEVGTVSYDGFESFVQSQMPDWFDWWKRPNIQSFSIV